MLLHKILGKNGHQDHHHETKFHRGDGLTLLELAGGGQLEGAQVQAVMVVPICEVVDEVTSNRVDTVVHCTLVSSATCSSKVGFKSWGAGVKVTHDIGVVSPTFSENVF